MPQNRCSYPSIRSDRVPDPVRPAQGQTPPANAKRGEARPDRGARRCLAVVTVLAIVLGSMTSVSAATGGLGIASLDNLRVTVLGHAETWGVPIGILLVIGGAVVMMRSIGLGFTGVVAGIIAVLAVTIIDEADQGTATGASLSNQGLSPIEVGGPLQAMLYIYGYFVMRLAQMPELWATALASLSVLRRIKGDHHA